MTPDDGPEVLSPLLAENVCIEIRMVFEGFWPVLGMRVPVIERIAVEEVPRLPLAPPGARTPKFETLRVL